MPRPTRVEINLGAIKRNVGEVLRVIGPERKLLIVVKADAYGHGAVPVSRAALAGGASYLGVALAEEGAELRRAHIKAPIIILMAMLEDDIPTLIEDNLIPVLTRLGFADKLNAAALKARRILPVHVNVDTGIGRIGFQVEHEDTVSSICRIAGMKGLSLEGVMTHFASSDEEEEAAREFTRRQTWLLRDLLERLAEEGVTPKLVHAANTGAIMNHPDSYQDMVRLGLSLYGYYPLPETIYSIKLEPALELATRIVHLKTCPPGSTISYGRTYTTERETIVATLPIGYADGYPRKLSNMGKVIVLSGDDGTRTTCPVIGRVCMDLTMIDVTEAVPGAAVGDEVIVYSRRRTDANSVEATAALLKTIPHTVTCELTKRVPRVYVDN